VSTGQAESGENQQRHSTIRAAVPADVPAILGLVRELAIYEREPEAVEATEAHFHQALFPQEQPSTSFAHVAVVDGTVVGMAIWYITFSTWQGRSGIWLEDLFISPQHRGSGLGKRLLATLAALCAERGYGRFEWWVLKWNTPSIGFYDSIGGQPMDDWVRYRLDGMALDSMACGEVPN
jgi:GNAT superfamily N-acetyltransferase